MAKAKHPGDYLLRVTARDGTELYSQVIEGDEEGLDYFQDTAKDNWEMIAEVIDNHFKKHNKPTAKELKKLQKQIAERQKIEDRFIALIKMHPAPDFGRRAYFIPKDAANVMFPKEPGQKTQIQVLKMKMRERRVFKQIQAGSPSQETVVEFPE